MKKTRRLFGIGVLLAVVACSEKPPPDLATRDAARDESSKTELILDELALEQGARVLDIFSGGGYHTQKLADIVGTDGEVYSWNNAFFLRITTDERAERQLASRYPQVLILESEIQDFEWPEDLDAILITTVFHDLWVPRIVGEEFDAVTPVVAGMFESLKPGGRLLLIDHVSPPGSEARFAANLHRIEEAYVEKLMSDAGFVLDKKLDVLRREGDNYSVSIFNDAVAGKTDRFVHIYSKPAD